MAYADYTDYEARYGALTTSQRSTVGVKLEDAATILDSFVEVDASDEQLLARLNLVSCAMVNRAMVAENSEAIGVSNASYTMGPFTQSATFSNPSGDMYLTSMEKRMLGIGTGIIGSVRPVIGGAP